MFQVLSRVQLFATPRTVAHQAPLSVGFLRQEYWSGLLFSLPGHLPNPGIKPTISNLSFMKFKVMFAVSLHCKSVFFSFMIIKYNSLWG